MDHYSYLCREFGYSSKQKAAPIPLFHYLKDKIHDNRKNKHYTIQVKYDYQQN